MWTFGAIAVPELVHLLRLGDLVRQPASLLGKRTDRSEELRDLWRSSTPFIDDNAIHSYWLVRRTQNTMSAAPLRRSAPRIGRNDPCSCGSGKKYKRCCLQ